MKAFLDPKPRTEDPRRCRVCGNYTLPRARRVAVAALLMVAGALLCYITIDIAEDGRLDNRIAHRVHAHWR